MISDHASQQAGVSRRDLLRVGGTTLLLTSGTACDLLSTEPSERSAETGDGTRTGREAPMLAQRVKAGDLPPVRDRLPKTPLAIKPIESIGSYGGIWRSWLQGLGALYVLDTQIGYENLVSWDLQWTEIVPNIAESWEIRGDGEEYVFHLRPGMKWSDGEPLTADDLVFTHDDVLLNSELYPVPPGLITIHQHPSTLEKIDDYTVKFSFPAPNGLFLERLATPDGNGLPLPRHYLEQFHPKYNSDVEQLASAEGFASWIELFSAKTDWQTQNADLPVLHAWTAVTLPGEDTAGAEFERNPYYWKTDSEGRQLPYLDRVSYELLELDVALLKTTNGEIDFNAPGPAVSVTTPQNKPVLARSREGGDYRFFDGTSGLMNEMVINLNLTHEDPKLRDVFRNRDFRIGLSYAINRQELIDTVFQRQGEPWQSAPRREAAVFHEELATQYSEFDVDQANQHLELAGYDGRDSAGRRLRPDGQPIRFTVGVVTEEPDQIAALELIKKYWADVGIEIQVRPMDRSLFTERQSANKHEANVWTGGGGWRDAILDPKFYFPFSGGSRYAVRWGAWYSSGGTDGEEPPAEARQQMDLYDRLLATTDNETQRELFGKIMDIAQEQFWLIGTVLPGPQYGTVRNNFHNTPEWTAAAWLYAIEGPTQPAQYYKS